MLFRSEERVDEDYVLDVMDFIYHEIYEAMVSRTSIPYAPYIMKLIKDTLPTVDFSDYECEEHKMKKLYVKTVKDTPMPAATDSFMGDARASGAAHGRHAPTKKTRAPSISKEVKKLNWFERNVLCMKVDIHKEQYRAHCERMDTEAFLH